MTQDTGVPRQSAGVLLELAKRCEQATGPDRELDEAIQAALAGAEIEWQEYAQKNAYHCGTRWINIGEIKPYTASLDAAMELVPEGMHGQVQFGNRPGAWVGHEGTDAPDFNVAVTPALALCAAALRARAQGPTP